MDYPGMEGFLGNRASFMLDVVFTAMFVVIPVMAASIYLVKLRRYELHKRIQMGLAIVLLIAITLFEIDIRLNGWRERALDSPFYHANWAYGLVNWSLWIHLTFAITTFALWAFVVVHALRRSPIPKSPTQRSTDHHFWAKLAAMNMGMTAITGCTFYVLAFVM